MTCYCQAGRIPCDNPVHPGEDGLVCVVCGKVLCKEHAGYGMDLSACENCQRTCESCDGIFAANQGEDVANDFLCRTCLRGFEVIRVEISPMDVVEIMPPLLPVFEESNQTV